MKNINLFIPKFRNDGIFDNYIKDQPYRNDFICNKNCPIKSITSTIKKK